MTDFKLNNPSVAQLVEQEPPHGEGPNAGGKNQADGSSPS